MFRVSVIAFVLACGLSTAADAQQRVQQPQRQGVPPVQLGVQTQDPIAERQITACQVQRIWTARNGLLIDCNPSGGQNMYMAYDGGDLPGGIAAAMALVTYADGRDEGLWIDYQLDPGNAICATVQASPNNYPCARVIAMGVSTPD